MDDGRTKEIKNKKEVLWSGVRGLCPNCGQGKLFKGYITQNKKCSVCQENLSNLRADDAPPWLTILITGHIMAPLIFFFVTNNYLPEFTETCILILTALLCVFAILPRAKGFFIAALWLTQRKNT